MSLFGGSGADFFCYGVEVLREHMQLARLAGRFFDRSAVPDEYRVPNAARGVRRMSTLLDSRLGKAAPRLQPVGIPGSGRVSNPVEKTYAPVISKRSTY